MQRDNTKIYSEFYEKEVNKKEISLTAYRAYYIFQLLLKSPLSKDEILAYLEADKILGKICHKDSIVNSINTLRAAGCEIEKPKMSNNYKYSITSHPFKINLSENQTDILNFIRKSLYSRNDYQLIFKINHLYDIIKSMTAQNEYTEIIESSNYFRNVDIKILTALINFCKEKSIITIHYRSPVNAEEEIKVKCEKIFFENKRLYLWGWSYKYNHSAYHRIDKITAFRKEKPSDSSDPKVLSEPVRYRLAGEAIQMFVPTLYEKIIEHNENEIIIESSVINKFNFFQRAASFAGDCEILSPDDMRKDFVCGLDKILEVYENE